jgi:hypothetical protein
MEEAVKDAVGQVKTRLATAKLVGNDARVAWQSELRRRAAKLEAEQQAAARAAAEQAAAEAAAVGEDAPPVAEVAAVEVPRTVAGGTGKSGTQVRVEPIEIVNDAECPAEWKQLIPAIARAVFASDVLTGKVKKPAPGESVIWRGVRFEAREFAVNRR